MDDQKEAIDSKINQLPKMLGGIHEVKIELRRSKIMIVGEDCAGKAAFANNIIGKKYEETESTVGINTFLCSVAHAALRNSEWKIFHKIEKEYENAIAEHLSRMKEADIENDLTRESNQIDVKKNKNGLDSSTVDKSSSLKNDDYAVDHQGGEDGFGFSHSKVEEREEDGVSLDHLKGDSTTDVLLICDKIEKEYENAIAEHLSYMKEVDIEDDIGMYVLVFNMEWLATDDMNIRKRCLEFIRFWLDSITVYSYDDSKQGCASIVIIGTRKDKVSSPTIHEKINTLLCEIFQTNVAWRSIIKNTGGNMRLSVSYL
jgi:hypothetical protein